MMLDDEAPLRGKLHVFVAFDWGDEIDLEQARRLLPAESQELARRRRTPSSITYRPVPLRYPLGTVRVQLPELGAVDSTAEAIVFDFGGVSVSLQIPFELPPVRWLDWPARYPIRNRWLRQSAQLPPVCLKSCGRPSRIVRGVRWAKSISCSRSRQANRCQLLKCF